MSRIPQDKSLASLYPDIAKEWDYSENEGTPNDYSAHSVLRVGWICPKGHHYIKSIRRRTQCGYGCSICSGKKVVEGINDLGTLRPELMTEWDFDKNYFVYPTEVSVMSNKKVWWKCSECGHSWQAPISNRTRGTGCPKCRYKRAVATRRGNTKRHTDIPFGELFPDLLLEWDYQKNHAIADPMKVTRGSGKKVWWKCRTCGHEWQATINNRSRGTGCLICSHHLDRRKKRAA